MDRLLLSDKEAQQALGIGRTKLDELKRAGHIAQVRIGRRTFVTTKSLHDYVESLTNQPEGN